jgi:adenylate cyclase
VSSHQPTEGTEIAALEARRNELEVRAEGALLGERRAALARVAMIMMFGAVTQLAAKDRPPATMYLGVAYSLYAIAVLVAVVRQKAAVARHARWIPVLTTVIDYSFTTTQSLLAASVDGFHAGQHALSSMLLMTFAVARLSVWHIVLAAVCAQVSWIVVTTHVGVATDYPTLFVEGGLVVMAFLLALTNCALGKMFHGLRQRDNLTRFLPRQVVTRVLEVGPAALAPVEREVTVLFSDIRGFTGLAEGLAPREVLAMLDDYFGRMAAIVKGHDGVVGKFLGDGLLAFWGVPDRIEDHAERAVRAARDMRRELIELNRHREREGLSPIRIGIGIHTGRVAAGMLGGQLQSEYTVIGDAVNVASRIEGLTKDHEHDLLLSETTWGQLADGTRARRIAEAQIRGRKEPVVLYGFSDDPDGGR